MDNYIRKLQVKSLFEAKTNLNVDFDEKINCLFGVNGSGKTTIISILVASMFCDIAKLITLPFSEVSIFIAPTKKKKAKLFFKVTKLENTIEYCFNTEYYETGNSENKQLMFDSSRFSKRDIERQDEKKKTVILNLINSQVSTTYVPLSRIH